MRIISGKARGTKLYTLEGYEITRPTLDRVKEALFSKINMELLESVVLDLFSGSGALGLEALSRGAKCSYLVDNSIKAIKVINQNVKKTKFEDSAIILKDDYLNALKKFENNNIKFDFVFIDPPYKTDYAIKSVRYILDNNLLNDGGEIIVETDIEEYVLDELKQISLDIVDVKKYGRVTLIFIRRKG